MPPGDGGGTVRTYRIPEWRITVGRYSPWAAGVLFTAILMQGGLALQKRADMVTLREENVRLRAELASLDDQVDGLARVVDRIQQFDARLRKVTMLSDPERNLAMGPVGGPDAREDAPVGGSSAGLKQDLLGAAGTERALEIANERLELLGEDARGAETSIKSLRLYLEDQQSLLASTPSLRPTRGWDTSGFGFRTDPYTGLRQMHAGKDIAADIGREVVASGNGLVTWAGKQGAYGNVVMLDHGHGLSSLYAHLSEVLVEVGEEVVRGAPIGKVGNTGRSTGPHLHYEIRLNGIPQDPEHFILE